MNAHRMTSHRAPTNVSNLDPESRSRYRSNRAPTCRPSRGTACRATGPSAPIPRPRPGAAARRERAKPSEAPRRCRRRSHEPWPTIRCYQDPLLVGHQTRALLRASSQQTLCSGRVVCRWSDCFPEADAGEAASQWRPGIPPAAPEGVPEKISVWVQNYTSVRPFEHSFGAFISALFPKDRQ